MQRGQRGEAGPVEVVETDQDRGHCGSLFEARSCLGNPPGDRIWSVTTRLVVGEPGERLTQRRAERGERDRLAELVRRSCDQGKALLGGLVGGVAEELRLAAAGLPVHQHQAASALLSTPQEVADHLLFRFATMDDLAVGHSQGFPVSGHDAAPYVKVPGGSSFVFGRMKPRTTIRSIVRHSEGFEPASALARGGASRLRMWVLTVLVDRDSSPAISGRRQVGWQVLQHPDLAVAERAERGPWALLSVTVEQDH